MAKRITRTYECELKRRFRSDKKNDHRGYTILDDFLPTDHSNVDYDTWGLDSQVKLGRFDLEKLGFPKRVRVTITAVE